MFCKTCGRLLVPEKTPYGRWMRCMEGHTQPELNQGSADLTLRNRQEVRRIEVISGENMLAVHTHRCKRCGYGKAELIEISANYSDEDNIYRYKCGQCGCVEQMEGKVK